MKEFDTWWADEGRHATSRKGVARLAFTAGLLLAKVIVEAALKRYGKEPDKRMVLRVVHRNLQEVSGD